MKRAACELRWERRRAGSVSDPFAQFRVYSMRPQSKERGPRESFSSLCRAPPPAIRSAQSDGGAKQPRTIDNGRTRRRRRRRTARRLQGRGAMHSHAAMHPLGDLTGRVLYCNRNTAGSWIRSNCTSRVAAGLFVFW